MPAQVSSDFVYLDYAATAPLCEEAAQAMAPYLIAGRDNLRVGGNANSLHSPGRKAFEDMESYRRTLAKSLGARRPDEIIMTSGATEADNAALFGMASAEVDKRKRAGRGAFVPHVITTAIEHDAVLAPARRLEAQGYRVTYLQPNKEGFIEVGVLEDALDSDTVLVSVQMANSEVGSIQPISGLAKAAHRAGALFHTDAVQALGKIPVNLEKLDVDAASFSAHKVGGPKGVGVLYLRARTPFAASMLGGGQETARRSGTQNVCGMAGFAAAAQASVAGVTEENARLMKLRDRLYAGLIQLRGVSATVSVGEGDDRFLPNIVHVLVDGLESETLILRLDTKGFGVSGGSACSSHSLEPSHVLRAMGVNAKKAHGALRISLGRYTKEEDVDAFLAVMPDVLYW